MSEAVKRYDPDAEWGNPVMNEEPLGDYVGWDDYERLEQECADARCQAELFKRAAEVFREDKDAALKQAEGLHALLTRARSSYVALLSDCGLKHSELIAEIDAALQAKPCAPTK